MLTNKREVLKLLKQLSKAMYFDLAINGNAKSGVFITEHAGYDKTECKYINYTTYYMSHKTQNKLKIANLEWLP